MCINEIHRIEKRILEIGYTYDYTFDILFFDKIRTDAFNERMELLVQLTELKRNNTNTIDYEKYLKLRKTNKEIN